MKAVILAGGSGTRLWPLSRKNYPKQFLQLNGDRSLLNLTVERLSRVVSAEDIIVMTNNEYKFHVVSDLGFFASAIDIILEPVSRNTAPAVALAVRYCLDKLGCGEDEVLFVCPSDHVIRPDDKFAEYVRLSEVMAKEGSILTLGVKPTRPETGYGYIKVGSALPVAGHQRIYKVEEFTEKPDLQTAERYVAEDGYYWNSGMFTFSIKTIIDEINRYAPEIRSLLDKSFDEALADFGKMPDISIDYAVMEKSDTVLTMPLDIYWNDIGSWDSIFELLEKDEDGNVCKGDVVTIDTRNSMVIGNKRLIATIGLEDHLIVETDDAVLISRKGKTQQVKKVFNHLREKGRREADEHLTVYRPWGSYTVLETGPRYKIKRIVVNPGEKLSLQKHHHRSEHWVVVRGAAKVKIGDSEVYIHENESAYVPKSTLHRLENPGKVPLEIIEVQNGEYVEEDDIERFDDRYGRATKD